MPMYEPRKYVSSPEYRATYVKWCRGVLVFYGCVGLLAVAAVVVADFAGIAVQIGGK
jgi:hypothetical protein